MAAKVHRLDDARRQLSAGTRVLDDDKRQNRNARKRQRKARR